MVLGDIGAAVRDQRLDHRLHLRDVLGRPRLDGRIERAERRHVRVELIVVFVGDACRIASFSGRSG